MKIGMEIRRRIKSKDKQEIVTEREDLADRRADEFAAKNDMTEKDGEVSSSFRKLGLLVQNETSYGHEIGSQSISCMIHDGLLPLLSLSLSHALSLSVSVSYVSVYACDMTMISVFFCFVSGLGMAAFYVDVALPLFHVACDWAC